LTRWEAAGTSHSTSHIRPSLASIITSGWKIRLFGPSVEGRRANIINNWSRKAKLVHSAINLHVLYPNSVTYRSHSSYHRKISWSRQRGRGTQRNRPSLQATTRRKPANSEKEEKDTTTWHTISSVGSMKKTVVFIFYYCIWKSLILQRSAILVLLSREFDWMKTLRTQ
jgi:hypothetical protein